MRRINIKFRKGRREMRKLNPLLLLLLLLFSTEALAQSTGDDTTLTEKDVPVYGHQIFKNNYKTIADNANGDNDSTQVSIVRIPDTYVLGVGDKLIVSIFGESQFDNQFEISSSGHIQPARLPKIFLKGVTWGQAKKLIQSRFSQFYTFNSDQFVVSLPKPRTISVNIFGEVEKPGSYNLSAVNTAFNALVVAGGPTQKGSVRNIKIIDGKQQKELDIYAFMTNPGTQFDYNLSDNMVIQVSAAQKIVEASGAIQRPMKYELKGKEGLKELIEYAGGLKADAFKELVQIKRFESDQQALLDINWQQLVTQKQNHSLQNGDVITIKAISGKINNIVSITGAVELPGNYSIRSTKRISDLLKKGILVKEARLDVAFLQRVNDNGTNKLMQLDLTNIINKPNSEVDLILERDDKLIVYTQERYVDKTTIKVNGAVRNPIEYPFDPDSTMTIQQAILLAGGLSPEATDFAYLKRTNPNNLKEKEYERIDIKAALANPGNARNMRLRPLDELTVLTASDYTDKSSVSIRGEVRNPGQFQYDASLKVSDVLTLAGGFKLQAAKNRLDVFRLEFNNNQPIKINILTLELDEQFNVIAGAPANFSLMPFDEIVVRTVPDFELQKFVKIEGEVLYPGEYALTTPNESLSSLIRRSGGLTVEAFPEGATIYRVHNNQGFVVTKLTEVLNNEKSKYNYFLKVGDVITIPKKKDFVTINLANTKAKELYPDKFTEIAKVGVAFEASKSAKWYINEYAAGFGENAAKKSVTVEYPNGAIKRTKNIGFFKIYPKLEKGAIISIGAKSKKEQKQKDKSDSDIQTLKIYPKLKKGTVISIGTDLEAKPVVPVEQEKGNNN